MRASNGKVYTRVYWTFCTIHALCLLYHTCTVSVQCCSQLLDVMNWHTSWDNKYLIPKEVDSGKRSKVT